MRRPVPALLLLVTGACTAQVRVDSSAKTASATGAGATPVETPASEEPHGDGKGQHEGVSVSFHKSGSVSGKISWQGRSGRLCRATTPFKFVGLAKFQGSAEVTPSGVKASGNGQASGKTSGGAAGSDCEAPRTPVPAPPPVAALKAPKPNADKTPTPPPPGPTPAELETPKPPPAEPPANVFGYEKPVLGCFEGQVFPLAPNAQKLPTSYEALTPVSVLYACEWDIAPRSWDQGFPGIADRFEWFAIRYAGAFRLAEAGDYTFRVSSDDGAKITIDGKAVVDNDGQHPPKEARSNVQLAAGNHQMVLEYFQGPRFQINLQVWITPPGKPEELFTVR